MKASQFCDNSRMGINHPGPGRVSGGPLSLVLVPMPLMFMPLGCVAPHSAVTTRVSLAVLGEHDGAAGVSTNFMFLALKVRFSML